MQSSRSSGRFNKKVTSSDGNNVVTVLDFNTLNSKFLFLETDYILGFLTVIEDCKVTVSLTSLAEASWPDVGPLASQSEQMAEIARVQTEGQKISLGLYTANGNEPWKYASEVVLQNQGFEEAFVSILVPFLTMNETLLVGGDFKLGVKINPKWNAPLKINDYLIIEGSWRQTVDFSKIEKSANSGIDKVNNYTERLTGEIIGFGGSSAPIGWLLCDGGEVLIAAYPKLWEVLGTTWGALTNGSNSAGVSHFRLPDLRGRTLVGAGLGSGLTNREIGQRFGSESHVLSTSELPSHNHTQNAHNHVQDAHNHAQNAHNHVQDAHNHAQNAHNHVQDAHNHAQNPHSHTYNWFAAPNAVNGLSTAVGSLSSQANIATSVAATATNQVATATNQVATATNNVATATNQVATAANQSATATNQSATATNQSATATNQSATATNQPTGGNSAHNNVQPSAVIKYLIFAG
ncbi:phage tail protein [Microcoleus anatoxicus]|uniref:Tail fiber protein n=1 Tax=Microcoleus anatoxicus PTRS2 TaxID=2705321 RepID=A0ABU8YNY9_9CYAN